MPTQNILSYSDIGDDAFISGFPPFQGMGYSSQPIATISIRFHKLKSPNRNLGGSRNTNRAGIEHHDWKKGGNEKDLILTWQGIY